MYEVNYATPAYYRAGEDEEYVPHLEEAIPFNLLTTSDTPRAALGKWQQMCLAMNNLLQVA